MSRIWRVNFDWTTAGTWSDRNDAMNLVNYRMTRGRHQAIKENGDGLERVPPGLIDITLDNSSGDYDPFNVDSPLYPKVEPGRFVRVVTMSDESRVLLHMDGVNNGTVFTDEIKKTWTAAGNAVTSTAQKKFGTASLLTANTNDYIWTPPHNDFWLQNRDWTWDFWLRMSSTGNMEYYKLIEQYQDDNNEFLIYYRSDSEYVPTYFGLSVFCRTGGIVQWDYEFKWSADNLPSPDTWYHVEVCRHGGDILAFVDGLELNRIDAYNCIEPGDKSAGYINGNVKIGGATGGTSYIDEARFMLGVASHITDFTPNTAAYPNPWRDRFTGQVENIQTIGGSTDPRVLITAYDGLKYLQNTKISTPIFEIGGEIAPPEFNNKGEKIKYISTMAEYPTIYGDMEIDATGTVFYCKYAYAQDKSAYDVIADIAETEIGLWGCKASGNLFFRSRVDSTAAINITSAEMLKDIDMPMPYNLRRNVAKVYINSMESTTGTYKLWKLNEVPLVSTAAGLTVWGEYRYDGAAVLGENLIQPEDQTDFKMNELADGSGADVTNLWNVTTTYFAGASKNVISADGALVDRYCIKLKNRGSPIQPNERTYKTYDRSGTNIPRYLTIDNPFIQREIDTVDFDKYIELQASHPLKYPRFQMENQPSLQFSFDLFDPINVEIAKYGIDTTYLVGAIEEEWLSENGQAVLTTVYTEPVDGLDTV